MLPIAVVFEYKVFDLGAVVFQRATSEITDRFVCKHTAAVSARKTTLQKTTNRRPGNLEAEALVVVPRRCRRFFSTDATLDRDRRCICVRVYAIRLHKYFMCVLH